MIPAELNPQWRDLPALAWLAATAFGRRLPGMTTLIRVGSWPLFLAVFTAARVVGELAANGRAAVVIVSERPGRGWLRYAVSVASALVVFVAPIAAMLAVLVAGAVAAAAGWVWFGRVLEGLGAVGSILVAVLVPVAACAHVRWRPLRELPGGRRWAAQRYPRVMEASTLAAQPGRWGAVHGLVRPLLDVADDRGHAVLAYAGDATLARNYARLGFRPVPSASGWMLCRPPVGRQSQPPGVIADPSGNGADVRQRRGSAHSGGSAPVGEK